MSYEELASMALSMRRNILQVSHQRGLNAHLGGGLSMVDILAVLYGRVLRFRREDPQWDGRDRFILSKGHGALGLYSALLVAGLLPREHFDSFQTNDSEFCAHPVMQPHVGIESSNGSLGQGLSMGVGIALGARKRGADHRAFVLVGDGECNEGSVWEALMLGGHLRLGNLHLIVDCNRFQSDGATASVIDADELGNRIRSFGWDVREVDGHDLGALVQAFEQPGRDDRPRAVVAHTVKGKGVSFMENDNQWHHKALTQSQFDQAMSELPQSTLADDASRIAP